jgi:hypothetical protein
LRELIIKNPTIAIAKDSKPFEGIDTWEKLSIPAKIIPYINNATNTSKYSLTNLTITAGEIGYRAFYGYSKLQQVDIIGSTSSIGESAFEQCVELKFVNIMAEVRSIGPRAFGGCIKLANIFNNDTVPN